MIFVPPSTSTASPRDGVGAAVGGKDMDQAARRTDGRNDDEEIEGNPRPLILLRRRGEPFLHDALQRAL